jgi:hypothetical protein
MSSNTVDQQPNRRSATKIRSRREEYSGNGRYSPPQDAPVRDTSRVMDYTQSGQTVRVKTKNVVFDNSNIAVIDKKRRSTTTPPGSSSRNYSRALNNASGAHPDDRYHRQNSLPDMRAQPSGHDSTLSGTNSYTESGSQPKTRSNAHENRRSELNQGRSNSRQSISNNESLSTENGAPMSQFLYNMWQNSRMCDVVVKINGQELPAHKLALAAHSEKLFSEYCERSPTKVTEINVSNTSAQAVQDILKFIYTSELSINIRNVDPLLGCAIQLGISSVISRCQQFLLNCNTDNVLAFMFIAEKHQLSGTLQHTLRYACNHFSSITKSSVFLHCTFDQIRSLTGNDNLKLGSELDVFFALVTWIDFNRQERLLYAVELMGNVRFVHVTPEDLATHVEPVTHIFQIPECSRMLYIAFR